MTEQEAFDCYRRMEKPTPAAVAEHFTELGRNLSCSKVKKWAAKGNWGVRLDLSSAISAINPATIVDELAKLGSEPPMKVIQGLAHRVFSRMAVVINQLEIRDIADFTRLQDLAAQLIKPSSGPDPDADKASQRITFAPFVPVKRE